MSILDSLIASVPYMQKMIKGDIMIGITDLDKFLLYEPSRTIDFQIRPGDPIPEDDRNLRTALAGQISSTQLPADIYGISILASAIPVRDEQGKIVGALATAQSLESQLKLEENMMIMDQITGKLVDMVQTVAAHSEELTATSENMLANTKQTVENSSEINQTIEFIKQISEQTNLLGLNAAIEAARVGDLGAGFGVVAKEVRKLSVSTREATTDISSTLTNIQNSIRQLETDFSQIVHSSQQQAELVTDFMTVIDQLNTSTQQMKAFVEAFMHQSE
ncbi:methyl-accepting chemotaxis protein [Fontibacillus sp. BL9]|uniref:methyl-accepting chemotaxis protein n=1 Tax=Fontibacillus sp. BL9 TaxID=3389971 RepID=UPI00397B619F